MVAGLGSQWDTQFVGWIRNCSLGYILSLYSFSKVGIFINFDALSKIFILIWRIIIDNISVLFVLIYYWRKIWSLKLHMSVNKQLFCIFFSHGNSSICTFLQVRNILYGDSKGWKRKFFAFVNSYFPIMNPHTRVVQHWNRFFVISCLVAIFIDPLFFYLFSVEMVSLPVTPFYSLWTWNFTVLTSIF